MDDQWLARLARGPDVYPEALALPVQLRGRHAVVIEPGLADGHHLRMHGQLDQLGHGVFGHIQIVGMNPHRRAEQAGVPAHQRHHVRPVFQIDGHAQRMLDPVGGHGGQHLRPALRVLRVVKFRKIQVTVGVDKHAARSDRVRIGRRF